MTKAPEQCLINSGSEVELNDEYTLSERNKRFWSNNASTQPNKRARGGSETKFYVKLNEVTQVLIEPFLNDIRMKIRQLCGWKKRGFPGTHSICMDCENYKTISKSSYMVTWKTIGKRYMMLIEERGKVYMIDVGDNVFRVDCIQFPYDIEYTRHLKDTLVEGEFLIDNIDSSDKFSFLINDIITYNGRVVSGKPFPDRLKLISQSIIEIRNKAIRKGHIDKAKQPFLVRNKDFFPLSEATKLLSPEFLETIPHDVDGLFFVPKEEPYMSGECKRLLKWKKYDTIEFRLKIVEDSSKKGTPPKKEAHLFVNGKNNYFAKMSYSPDLEVYGNKIISCLYKDNEWHFHQLRNDRPLPNSEQTAKGIMESIKRKVTPEVLYDFIKNQSE
jgi:mRNA-capping enzyme